MARGKKENAKSAMAASPPPAARSTARKQASSAGAYAALPRALVGEHHGRTPLYLVVVYVLFKWALPALAALTPPGIDPREVIRVADDDALAGWKTGDCVRGKHRIHVIIITFPCDDD